MKVLFCGLGSIGQRHLRNLLKMQEDKYFAEDLEILAYRARGRQVVLRDDLTVEEGVSLAQKYDFQTYSDLGSALAQKPDVVFITNPINMHLDVLGAVIEQTDADIFVEKPLAHTLEGLSELANMAKEKGITVFTGFQNRFHPCIKKAKELLENGSIGDVVAANIELGEYMPATRKYEDYRESTAVKKSLGGGVIIAQIHEIDYAYLLFGMPRSVYAVGGKLSDLEIDVEDTASILLTYECGNGAAFPVHLHMDFVQSPPTRSCKIVGTRGKIELDLLKPVLICYNETGEVAYEDSFDGFVRNDMFVEELETFFAIRRGEIKPILDIAEGMKSLEIALAAKKSMETQNVVIMNDDLSEEMH